jgi:hypothetical protein
MLSLRRALAPKGGAETYADHAQWEATRASRARAPRAGIDAPPARERPRTKRRHSES